MTETLTYRKQHLTHGFSKLKLDGLLCLRSLLLSTRPQACGVRVPNICSSDSHIEPFPTHRYQDQGLVQLYASQGLYAWPHAEIDPVVSYLYKYDKF